MIIGDFNDNALELARMALKIQNEMMTIHTYRSTF